MIILRLLTLFGVSYTLTTYLSLQEPPGWINISYFLRQSELSLRTVWLPFEMMWVSPAHYKFHTDTLDILLVPDAAVPCHECQKSQLC